MFGLIRKNELKRLLDKAEIIAKTDCGLPGKNHAWVAGNIEIIYTIAGYFGIKLASMKDGEQDE